MELSTMDNGKKIKNMEIALSNGQMEANMKVAMLKARCKVKEKSNFLTDPVTRDHFSMTNLKEKVAISGQMVKVTRDHGKNKKWKVLEF